MTDRPNTNTPGRMYDKIRAQRDRASAKLDEAIARLRGTHRLRFQSYIIAQLQRCSDPDELRGMLDRLAEKEAARTPGDPFWQIRDLLSFVGHLAKSPPQAPAPAASPPPDDAEAAEGTEPDARGVREPLDEKRLAVARGHR